MFEADSQNFAAVPSVPRGFALEKFWPAFGGDHKRRGVPATPPPPLPLSRSPPPPPLGISGWSAHAYSTQRRAVSSGNEWFYLFGQRMDDAEAKVYALEQDKAHMRKEMSTMQVRRDAWGSGPDGSGRRRAARAW